MSMGAESPSGKPLPNLVIQTHVTPPGNNPWVRDTGAALATERTFSNEGFEIEG